MTLVVEKNNIYQGDCFNYLHLIPDDSVQLILVDLPYGDTDSIFDVKIDLTTMWTQLKRIGMPNCNYVFFCSSRFGCDLINSNYSWYSYDIVWKKTQPVGYMNCRTCPLKSHEMIYVFKQKNKVKGYKCVYNPQKTMGMPYTRQLKDKKVVKDNDSQVYNETNKKIVANFNDGWRYPTTIVEFVREKKDGKGHPTQKPEKLCEWLIKTFSNEGDLVVDFCMGSGTTCVAALATKRDYIGIELTEKWFNVSKERIKDYLVELEKQEPLEIVYDSTDPIEVPLEIIEDEE